MGLKLKIKSAPVKAATPTRADPMPPDNPKRHPGSMPTSLSAATVGMSEERKALYREANEFQENNAETPPAENVQEEEVPGSEIPDTPPEEGATETPPVEGEPNQEEEVPDGGTKSEKHTVVPHAALHAERESHKETKQKLREVLEMADQAKMQLQVLLTENQRLQGSTVKTPPADVPDRDEPIEDIEQYVKDVRKDVQFLKSENERLKQEREEEIENAKSRRVNDAISLMNTELAAEGFPGFDKYHDLVAARIEEKAKGDRIKLIAMDNAVGWKKIYREEIFPEMASVFKVTVQKTKKEDKEALKEEANLGGGGGAGPVKTMKKVEKPWGLTDYFSMRQDKRLA